MTSVRFGRESMRRNLTSLMILAMAVLLPVVTIAGVCAVEPQCCVAASADEARLIRADCCADPCADVTRDTSTTADAATQNQRLDRGSDQVPTVALSPQIAAPAAASGDSAAAPSPPDLDRRLASLSILLI